MLKSYSIDHYRAIEYAKIDFSKSKIDYRNNYVVDGKIINPGVLYGNNGTGKSLALNPFGILTYIMNYEPNSIPNSLLPLPDVMDSENKTRIDDFPSFTYSFDVEGIEFVYQISFLANAIISEKLTSKKRILFSRKRNSYVLNEKQMEVSEFYPALRKIGIEEYSKEQETQCLIKMVYDYLSSVVYIDASGNVFGKEFEETNVWDTINSVGESFEKEINHILSIPDITFITKVNEKTHEPVHYFRFIDSNKELPAKFASDGMQETLKLVLALEACCKTMNRIVVVDDIDKSLHPIALKKTVDEFVGKGIQLICSTHDTNLMRFLRPDQIYFSYFGNDLHTTIHRLNDIFPRLREINSIENMYLKGIFDWKMTDVSNGK